MNITDLIGKIPHRMAFAGGWIDQPFLSKHNPEPPGSMVVVSVEPQFHFMDRCGMASSTRKVAQQLWPGGLPQGDPAELVRQLYHAENMGLAEPSGSQDMVGLIYSGISRIDYDFAHEGGYFPVQVESNNDPQVAGWLDEVIYILPVMPRPQGYKPLGIQNLDPRWVQRLGQTGKDCYNAIVARDLQALGASFNACMLCWETLLPHVVRHPTIKLDLMGLLGYYQKRYAGAMFSGSGGGYFYVASNEPVPGAFHARVRVAKGYAEYSR
jgi:hypothetical protein